MLCVTSTERIVMNISRAEHDRRQTLMNASSPMKARSPTTNVAHGSRCAAAADHDRARRPTAPAPMHARRHASWSEWPKRLSAPIAKTSAHSTRPSSLDPRRRRSSTIRGATIDGPRAEVDAVADHARRAARYAATFSSDESAPKAAGSARSSARNASSSAPVAVVDGRTTRAA